MAQQPWGRAFGCPVAKKSSAEREFVSPKLLGLCKVKAPHFSAVCNPLFSVAGTSLVEGKAESTKAGLVLIFCYV